MSNEVDLFGDEIPTNAEKKKRKQYVSKAAEKIGPLEERISLLEKKIDTLINTQIESVKVFNELKASLNSEKQYILKRLD